MIALTVTVAFECSCLHAHGLPFQRYTPHRDGNFVHSLCNTAFCISETSRFRISCDYKKANTITDVTFELFTESYVKL
jgi:hypothetical protein